MLVALGLSALTYVARRLSLSGLRSERLNFARTMLAQLAGSFVTLVTPAAVGGAALNVRYLQRNKVPPAVAAASVGVSQVVAFVLHIVLLVIFVAITGARSHSLRPPTWVYFVIAGLVVAALGGRGGAARPAAAPGPARPGARARCCPGCSRCCSSRANWPRASAARSCSPRATSSAWPPASARFGGSHRAHQRRRGVPDRQRPGLRGAHPRRARCGRGRPGGRAHRDRDGGAPRRSARCCCSGC